MVKCLEKYPIYYHIVVNKRSIQVRAMKDWFVTRQEPQPSQRLSFGRASCLVCFPKKRQMHFGL